MLLLSRPRPLDGRFGVRRPGAALLRRDLARRPPRASGSSRIARLKAVSDHRTPKLTPLLSQAYPALSVPFVYCMLITIVVSDVAGVVVLNLCGLAGRVKGMGSQFSFSEVRQARSDIFSTGTAARAGT
jgi:hypothetical protein